MNEKMTGAPVLLVEDDENDIFFFQLALETAALHRPLQVATDGDQALAYLAGDGTFAQRDEYPLPFVVVLDLNLPRKTGLEVLKWIRGNAALNHIPVVVLTSSTAESDRTTALELGADQYWMKPGDPLQLTDY